MVIGVVQFELLLPQALSLKDKRRVVQSVKDRLHREHLVAVAEVGEQEMLNVAVLGVAAVSADGNAVGKTLDAIDAKLRGLRDAEVGKTSRRVIQERTMKPSVSMSGNEEAILRREMLSLMEEGDE
ncbi:hypothetical protein MNBD_PLANCTO03-49 [hydrothermal vent metagenome]|uniref:YlxP-like protein n=1 Tax=hydrothermal vent metagenome TaxID=652676 RepID=A0A3B1DE17_9ZZZZ